MTVTADKDRRVLRKIADAEAKRIAKPYVLSITEQRKNGLGYVAENVTTYRYVSRLSLINALKRRHGGLAWRKAANGVSYIFAETTDNGSKRLMVNAYHDNRKELICVSVDINEMVEEVNGVQPSTKQ